MSGSFTFPLDDAATADPTKIGTENYTVQLEKGQGRCTSSTRFACAVSPSRTSIVSNSLSCAASPTPSTT